MRDALIVAVAAVVGLFVILPLMRRPSVASSAAPAYAAPTWNYPFYDQSARSAAADTQAALHQLGEWGISGLSVTVADLEDAEQGIAMRRAAGLA